MDEKEIINPRLITILVPIMKTFVFPALIILIAKFTAERKKEERIKKEYFFSASVLVLGVIAFRVIVKILPNL